MNSSRTPVSLAIMLAASFALGPGGAAAQSLQAVHEAALTYDGSYRAARAISNSASHRTEQANALLRPNLRLTATAARTRADPAAVTSTSTGVAATTNAGGVALNARVPVYNAPLSLAAQQTQLLEEVYRADLVMAEHDLITRVAQAYFDVLAADEVLTAARAGEKAIGEQLIAAKRAYEIGTATITDAREAQARADLATAQRLAAENDLRIKGLALNMFLGKAQVKAHRLKPGLALPSVTPQDMEHWATMAETRNPGVRRAEVALDVARMEIERARAGHLPTLDIVGSLGPGYSSTAGVGGKTNTASIGVQVAMPLYEGGITQARVKEALALQDKAQSELEQARRSLAQGARAAFLTVQSGQAQIGALEAAEASTRLALRATQTGYRVGVRVNIDILNAQTQLFQTQRDLALARYNVLLGGLRLKQSAGSLGSADLAELDALLLSE